MVKYTKIQRALKPALKELAYGLLLSLPIIIFLLTFALQDRNDALYGDWDYFAQLYEAMRQSILEYGQFPWWNPWVVGGIPLYANPQFGLISIQTPFVLLFGTLQGLHYAVIAYHLLGFWGMYRLLIRFRPNAKLLALTLAYTWVFSGFPAWHIAGGHLTFATYLLAPWLFLALLNIRSRLGWLWLGLLVAFLINQSLHYMVIQMFFVAGLYAIYELIRHSRGQEVSLWSTFKPYVWSLLIILPLSAHRVYYTLQYVRDYTRIPAPEIANSTGLLTAALTFRHPIDSITAFHSQFGWAEYSVYFGVLTLGLLIFAVFRSFEKGKFDHRWWLLISGMVLFLLLALGPFSDLSPYSLLRHLPVFEQMQVASRWLAWFVLVAVIFLVVRLPRKPFVYIVLVMSLADVFIVNRMVMSYEQPPYTPPAKHATQFEQYAYYKNQPVIERSSLRFLHATQSNIGDTFGYEPLAEFSIVADREFSKGLTIRCGSNQGDCPFVKSLNAKVSSWSPQHLVLERTGPGTVELNMNPGKDWYINGKAVFSSMRDFETKKRFTINDPAKRLVIDYRP